MNIHTDLFNIDDFGSYIVVIVFYKCINISIRFYCLKVRIVLIFYVELIIFNLDLVVIY